MAACCGIPRCNCRVTAGPGVTVEGNGSAATPYVVSADSATPTAVQAADTTTVDTTVAGSGTAADPYTVSSDVILDPAPPAGGTNLLTAGPDGLYVECADVRGCLSAGDGAAYDPATGEITARVSGDAGNTTTIGSDGGLFTPAGSTAVEAADTNTVDTIITGSGATGDPYQVAAAVILDPAPPGGGSNLLQESPDGLYVECADVRGCFSAGDGAGYDPATGEITARLSADAGNTVAFGSDGGLYAAGGGGSTPTVVEGGDTPTAQNTVTGSGSAADPYVVTTDVVLDPTPPQGGTNLIGSGPEGLFLECADVRGCLSAGDGITYDPATGEIAAKISGDAGNTTTIGADGGLYTPAGSTALQAADTNTVDISVNGTGAAGDPYVVEADVILAPTPNGVEAGADGLLVAPSADTGNRLAFGADGRLFVPPVAPPEVGCGLQGDGTAASPLAAFPIAGSQPWADDWGCDATTQSTLKCDPDTGALWTPPEHYSIDDHLYIDHMDSPVTQGVTTGWVSLSPGGTVASVAWNVPANAFGNMCRDWGYTAHIHASVDVSANSTATFEVGYILQLDGTVIGARPIEGVYTAFGSARRERYAGSVSDAFYRMSAATARQIVMFPAINVLAGSITINSWISDATLSTQTRD